MKWTVFSVGGGTIEIKEYPVNFSREIYTENSFDEIREILASEDISISEYVKNEWIKEAPEFTFGKNGKPYLKNESGIYFSLSHCRNSCACVVSGSETAVDIADIRRISDRTAKYFCTKEELEAVNSSENKENELVKLWAVKECYSKLDGSGLHMDYRSIGEKEKAMIKVIKGERYFAAVCCKEDAKAVKLTAEQCLSF